jgi:WD40-like Beta Propeller Repeat
MLKLFKVTLATTVIATALAAKAMAVPQFSDWAPPANLESLPGSSPNLNTAAVDGCASLSPDGLAIYFLSFRGGNADIYVAKRSSTTDGYGDPVALPPPVNTAGNEICPTIARGNRLYFTAFRDDPAGDLYVSKRGPKGWSEPVRLGPNINVNGRTEEAPSFYEDDEGREVMIFSRRPPGPPTGEGGDLYQSVEGGPATLIQGGANSSAGDNRASVTHDGRTLFWDSTRFGSLGDSDLWYATRSDTSAPWGAAIHLIELSSPAHDSRPYISWDGAMLVFTSGRPGSESPAPDNWFTTRMKQAGRR